MRRKILSVLLCVCLMVGTLLVFAPTARAYSTGDDYPYHVGIDEFYVDEWNFYKGECTSFVAWCLNTRNGIRFTNQYMGVGSWGHAYQWAGVARRLGISVDMNPTVGSVAWSGATGASPSGHVAWVSAVNGSRVTIEEYNQTVLINGTWHGDHKFHTRTVDKSSFDGYIHIKDIGSSQPPAPNYPTDVRVFTEDGFLGRIYYPAGGKYLENRNGNVQIADFSNTDPRQIWHFKREGNAYIIRNLYDGRNFDSATGQGAGANVAVWKDNGDAAQRWYFYRDAGGDSSCFNIASSFDTSLVVDVDNASTSAGANVQAWTRNATPAQAFSVHIANNNVEYMISQYLGTDFYAQIKAMGAYLQVSGLTSFSGSGKYMDVVTTQTSAPTNEKQIWHFIRQSDGSYKIVNVYNGWCLDLCNGDAVGHQQVWTWDADNNTAAQRWIIMSAPGDSFYRIASRVNFPGDIYSLDIADESVVNGRPVNGTKLQVWKQNEAVNQQFTISKVNYSTSTPTPKPSATPTPTPAGPITPKIEDPASAGDIEYGQKLSASLLISGRVTDGSGNTVPGTWTWKEPDTIPTSGSYPAIFTPNDTTKYNIPSAKNINIKVSPATPQIALSVPSSQAAGGQVTVGVTVTNPNDPGLTNVPSTSVTYKIGAASSKSVSGGKFTIPKDTPAGTIIAVTAKTGSSSRYNAAEKSSTLTVSARDTIQITGVSPKNSIYNGQRQAGYTGTPSTQGENVRITYTGRNGTSYNSSTQPKNAGNYTVTFTADNGAAHGELSLDFTIIKASITIRADNKNVPTGGRLPSLTYTVTGLASGDILSAKPQLDYVNQPDLSAPTSYVIKASGARVPSGGNYNENITYIDGLLNVYPADEPTPTPDPTPGPDQNTEIFFAHPKWYLTPGKNMKLVALDVSAEPYSDKLEWWSDNTSVATVDGSGNVIGIKNGNAVIRASTSDGKYTASCTIVVGPWYQSAIDFVLEHGLMSGYSDGSFGANDRLSRAQLAQILYNKEGRPTVTVTDKFSDIRENAWYSKAVSWAADRKIVSGYGNGRFGHGDPITRQDLAVMLWRYAGAPNSGDSTLNFSDVNEISSYAKNAMHWAVENKIMSGSGGKLNPRGYATRAEVAQMLKNYLQ